MWQWRCPLWLFATLFIVIGFIAAYRNKYDLVPITASNATRFTHKTFAHKLILGEFPADVVVTPKNVTGDIWFQQPPFDVNPEYFWETVSVSDPARIGAHAKCTEDVFPCCEGMSHNGGGHAFRPDACKTERMALRTSKKYRSGLQLMRALGNRTLVMAGDSVAHQQFMSLECACRIWKECKTLERKDYGVPETGCNYWRARISGVDTIKIQVDDNIVSTLIFVHQYQPCIKNLTWDKLEQTLVADLKPDVLILPVLGAHYAEHVSFPDMNPTAAYDAVQGVFGGFLVQKMLKEGKQIIFVEANAQHPVRPGGDWWGGRELDAIDYNMTRASFAMHGGTEGCLPIRYEPDTYQVVARDVVLGEHAWKSKLARVVLEEKLNLSIWWSNQTAPCQRGAIAWVPFYELSSSRPDLHPITFNSSTNVSKCPDATHLCYSAFFWVPFVDYVARTLIECSVIGG